MKKDSTPEGRAQPLARARSSFSVTASRMNSARRPGPASASICAMASADSRTCVAFTPSAGRPMRGALSGIFFSAKPCMKAIPPIDQVTDAAYIGGIGYGGKSMARTIVKAEFDTIPMGNKLMKRKPYACPHFGGHCLGDGCINWTPIGSPPGQQSAQCFLERGMEPVHRAECERKAANAEREVRHMLEYEQLHRCQGRATNSAAVHRYRARMWRWMAETAPEREEIAA